MDKILKQIFEDDKNVIRIEAQQKKQINLIGRIKPHKGHSLFKRSPCGKISKVDDSDFFESVFDPIRRVKTKKIKPIDGYIYVSALNEKNAIKKFLKIL